MQRPSRPRNSAKPPSTTGLRVYKPTGQFAEKMFAACFVLSASTNTRKAYWSDARAWLFFCRERDIDPQSPAVIAVVAWVESMKKDKAAPKTVARRINALCSIYRQLRRDGLRVNNEPINNPFSPEDGPRRESALAIEPTPAATPKAVKALLDTCDASFEGVRDKAILRILWATGARRASVSSMTFERLEKEGSDFVAAFVVKGNKEVRVLIMGRAAEALRLWIERRTPPGGRARGPVWVFPNGSSFVENDVWAVVRRRAKMAGVEETITPHTFRVAFLTLNPADLESKQDAAGHADPATTRLYDRKWRGRSAFESMPEVEDLEVLDVTPKRNK
jgi:integrase/recombinase XerD